MILKLNINKPKVTTNKATFFIFHFDPVQLFLAVEYYSLHIDLIYPLYP